MLNGFSKDRKLTSFRLVDSHTARFLFDRLICGPLMQHRTIVRFHIVCLLQVSQHAFPRSSLRTMLNLCSLPWDMSCACLMVTLTFKVQPPNSVNVNSSKVSYMTKKLMQKRRSRMQGSKPRNLSQLRSRMRVILR